MFVPNNLRPFASGLSYADSTQEHARPPAGVLDAPTNTLISKLDLLRSKRSAAGSALETLRSPAAQAAAEATDLRAAADAAAAGTAIPGHDAAEQLKADIVAKEFELEALRVAIDEAVADLAVKRSDLSDAGSADTTTAAANLLTAIDDLEALFNTYSTLEARDAWFNGSVYAIRANVVNKGLLPGLYSGQNMDGYDSTPVAAVIAQLQVALGPGVA